MKHQMLLLSEVFAQRKFNEEVNGDVINRLRLLKAPQDMLKDRSVFEPLVLVARADFIASGRIIVDGLMFQIESLKMSI
mgnify:CR=1 FL=1